MGHAAGWGSGRTGGSGRLARRRALTLLSCVGVATAGLLLAGVSPAQAASGISSPSDGATITSQSPASVKATGGTCGGSLSVQGPGFSKSVTTTANGGSMTVTVDPASASNGGYTATLIPKNKPTVGSCQSAASSSRSFTLRVAPDAPTGVDAQLTGNRQITVSWKQGGAFDVSKYALYNASTGDVLTSVPADDSDFCSSTNCSIAVNYDDAASGTQSFNVTAMRPSGGSGSVESAKSSTKSATLPAAPTPDPTVPPDSGGGDDGGSGGGGTGGGGTGGGGSGGGTGGGGSGGGTGGGAGGTGGGSGSGGSGGAGGGAGGITGGGGGGLTFSASSGSIVLPPAPPAAILAPGNPSPVVGPIPEGSYKPGLPYGERSEFEKVTHRNAAQQVFHSVGAAFDAPRLVRSLAGAVLLLIAAAHLRVWLNRLPE